MYNGIPGYDMVDGKLVINEVEAEKLQQALDNFINAPRPADEGTLPTHYRMAEELAQCIQSKMEWDQSEDKLKEIVQFVLANIDEHLGMIENIVRIIDLYQRNNHEKATGAGMAHVQSI